MSNNYQEAVNSLDEIHKKLKAEYYSKYTDRVNQATEIQQIFKSIKNPSENSKLGKALLDLMKENSGLKEKFRKKNNEQTSSKFDDIFEEAMVEVIKKMAEKAGIQEGGIQFKTGREKANTLFTTVDKNIQDIMREYKKKITGEKNSSYVKPVARSGKNDLSFSITAEPTGDFADCLKLLTQYSFSFKNYQKNKRNYFKIGLGETDLYKVIYSTLTPFFKQKDIDNIFYPIMYKYNNNEKTEAIFHFNHLRFIYELTGRGLYVDDKPLKSVDFLVINDPNSENIYVYDTAKIIFNKVFSDQVENHKTDLLRSASFNIFIDNS